MPVVDTALIIWLVAALATCGVILRPWRIPEYVWAMGGALLLTMLGLIAPQKALAAMAEGGDVYLFLIGMMVLAELARQEGLFDWLARYAVSHARGSGQRLFDLVFLVGTLVTVFLSNDATAVVLTPAVYAACKAAKAEPLPYLFICAFIANAASFVLPISNPANLVVFGSQMPPLLEWLRQFSLPSLAAISLTYIVLRLTQRKQIMKPLALTVDSQPLTPGAKLCALGIVLTGALLLTASALDTALGLPTFCAGLTTTALIHLSQ
ncbi:SLC13 family permease, partial [Pseudomonas shirazensis]